MIHGGMIQNWCGDGRIELRKNLGNGTLLDVTTRAFGHYNLQTNASNAVDSSHSSLTLSLSLALPPSPRSPPLTISLGLLCSLRS
jgi:hypothetical protein